MYYVPHFIDPLICQQTLGLLPHFVIVNDAAINRSVQIFVSVPAFKYFEEIPWSGINGSHVNSMLHSLRSCHVVFHSGCTILLCLFIWQNNILLYGYTPFCLSTHPLMGHFNYFYLLATVNSAAMNIHVRVFGWTPVFNSLVSITRNEVVEPHCIVHLIFWGNVKVLYT